MTPGLLALLQASFFVVVFFKIYMKRAFCFSSELAALK